MISKDAKLKVRCSDCGEETFELVEHIAGNDIIPCSICAGIINLGAPECQEAVAQAKKMMSKAF